MKATGRARFLNVMQETAPDLVPESFYEDLSDEDMRSMAKMVHAERIGFINRAVMICNGDSCPRARVCKLLQRGKAPVNDSCPVELEIVQAKMDDYVKEYEIKPDNVTDVNMVAQLISIDLLIGRLMDSANLADAPSMIVDAPAFPLMNGDVVYKREAHPAMDQIIKLMKQQQTIISMMAGDRDSKWRRQAALGASQEASLTVAMAATHKLMSKAVASGNLRVNPEEVLTPEQLAATILKDNES